MKNLNTLEERLAQQVASLQVIEENLKGNHNFEVEGLELLVLKDVFSPKLFHGWSIMTPALRDALAGSNKRVLEIGCGTGVTSLLLAKDGHQVVCTDINIMAVENTRLNASHNKIELESVILSDIFENFDTHEKFDAIYWNSPWQEIIGREHIDNILEFGLFDRGFNNHKRLFDEIRKYLTPAGKFYLGHASFGDYERLETMLEEHGFNYKVIADEESVEVDPVEFYLYECWPSDTRKRLCLSSESELDYIELNDEKIISYQNSETLNKDFTDDSVKKLRDALDKADYFVFTSNQKFTVSLYEELRYAKEIRRIPIICFQVGISEQLVPHYFITQYIKHLSNLEL